MDVKPSQGEKVGTTAKQRFAAAAFVIASLSVGVFIFMVSTIEREVQTIETLEEDVFQYILAYKVLVVAQRLVTISDASERDSLRERVRYYIGEMELIHDKKIHVMPPAILPERQRKLFFEHPVKLDSIFHSLFDAGYALADAPDSLLTLAHPSLAAITGTDTGDEPRLVSARLVAESMATLSKAKVAGVAILVMFLGGLIVVAFTIVWPLVNEIQRETRILEVANAELNQLSMQDALSGLANRRAFDKILDEEWRRMTREHREITCLMIDIDGFKAFNDRYGHPAGDECIVQIAEVLDDVACRGGQSASRIGGEEFAVLLPSTGIDQGSKVAEKIRQNVLKLKINHETSQVESVVTVSVGVAVASPTQGSDSGQLISGADRALYAAKRSGRNRVFAATDLD